MRGKAKFQRVIQALNSLRVKLSGAKTFKRFLNASTSKEMHESQGSLSYKQTPKSSKISKFQTISNNFKQFQTISQKQLKTD